MSSLSSNSAIRTKPIFSKQLQGGAANAASERPIVTIEMSLSDHRRLKRLAAKTGLKKSAIMRALLKLGLEEAKNFTSEEDLIKLVRLGKL